VRVGRISYGAQPLVAVERDHAWFQVDAPDVSLLDVLVSDGYPPRLATQPLVGEREPAVPLRPLRNMMCLGKNFREHAIEFAAYSSDAETIPAYPIVFTKAPEALCGAEDPIEVRRAVGAALDYEVELAVVIGKKVCDLPRERWREAVAGYTIFNDITARDLQLEAIEANLPWDRSKGFDTFGPIGPYLVTPEDVPDPHDLDLEIRVGDRVLQSSNTRHMIFDIPRLLEDISAGMTLEPGDIIGTGTPEGIGPVEHGDVMEATVGNLGTLRSPVHCATEGAPLIPA
jgi:5-oxopent-3-ene-1,2,5-tricarboxylate decarboxylase / 2-hydroxyhepta-2,4-diene-1,7-dioate isomerase